jgi:hypothetical protein
MTGMFEFLFGPYESWDERYLTLKGAQDIIRAQFNLLQTDPINILGAIHQV